MNPLQFAEFEFNSAIHSPHRQRNAIQALAFALTVILLVNLPIISLVRNLPIDVSESAAAKELNSIKVPTFQLDPKVAAAALAPPDHSKADNAALTKIITDYANSHAGKYSVSLFNLKNPVNNVSYNANNQMLTASTYKLFAAYNALIKVEQGVWSMSTPTGFGTLDYCLRQAILYSDNDCGEAIGGMLGWHTMTLFVQASGYTQTALDSPRGTLSSSSRDFGNLLINLYSGKLLNAEHTSYLLGLMKNQVYRSGIPAGSGGSVVADKTGNLNTTNDDVAIVYSSKATYVLVIMTDGASIGDVRALSQQIYNFYNP
ncbi:MAG TPA: serine hydrolase [Candidatus Saccharimonadales bacterium]|nr:serine hydrolase [Candidatus Saccharimonadales bacterium]